MSIDDGENSTTLDSSEDTWPNAEDLYCGDCQFGQSNPFKTAGELALHNHFMHEEHEDLACLTKRATKCSRTFPTLYERYTHSLVAHGFVSDCPSCNRSFDTVYVKGIKMGLPKAPCDILRNVREHLSSCMQIPVYRCPVCHKVVYSQGYITTHLKEHPVAEGQVPPPFQKDESILGMWGM